MRGLFSFIMIGLALLIFSACGETKHLAEETTETIKERLDELALSTGEKLGKGLYAKMTTNRGDIIIKLFDKRSPLTVANFVGLAEGNLEAMGKTFDQPYYDGLKFHRVISKANGDRSDFMIQGGDPQGTGAGGPGYSFWDETKADDKFDKKGILAMANAGPNTNGSQFFITIIPTPHLNAKHTIFGEVVEGQDIVDNTLQGDTIERVAIYRIGVKFNATQVFNEEYEKIKVVEEEKELARKKLKAQDDARLEVAKSQSPDEYKDYFYGLVKEIEPKAIQTESGVVYVIKKKGTGEHPEKGDHVSLHYYGKHLFGDKFDSSYDRNTPFEIDYLVTGLIPGFNEGIGLSKKDMEIDVYIPYFLAYGTGGRGPTMPAYSDLIFQLKILDIQKK